MIVIVVIVCLNDYDDVSKHTKHVDVGVEFIVDRGSTPLTSIFGIACNIGYSIITKGLSQLDSSFCVIGARHVKN